MQTYSGQPKLAGMIETGTVCIEPNWKQSFLKYTG